VGIHFGHGPVVLRSDGIGRVDDARSIGVGNVELVWCGQILRSTALTEEGDRFFVRGSIQGHF
jgi:hypothetical protein